MKDPILGMQLANFHVERLLGQGGMASVYYGQDIKLHRPVAIKVLDKRYKNHPAYAGRFVNEARMMAKWRHENIIQIYYADESQGFPYYVMEYVDGQDLADVMSNHQSEGKLMPIADVLRIGNAIANALDYAHRQGVIHRDVKPSNILLSKDGRVLLGDFGMALEVQEGSVGNTFGTPHYISPEQARRSADAIPQSDIYSLGVILYEIFTGSVPFDDPTPANIALMHISQKPPAPRSINPDVSQAVEAVLIKALEKKPQDRYQTGAKLMAALEDAVKAADVPKVPALPPLPVGVPTVRRSESSIAQISKRPAPKQRDVNPKPVAKMPATVRASNQFQKRNIWIGFIILILIIGIGGFFFARNGIMAPALTSPATETVAPTSTPEPAQPTQTFTQAPTLPSPTETVAPTNTTVPPTSTNTPAPLPTIFAEPTIKYPEGNHYRAFYNETSFYLLNISYGRRSISGFRFQRLDSENLPAEDIFDGYQWESRDFDYLPRNFCANITIYGDQDPPYLNPAECSIGLMTTIQPRFDRPGEILFWTPKDGSTQFRVLWLDEEIARCSISAGVCEIYIP